MDIKTRQSQIDYWNKLYSDKDILYPLDDIPFMERILSACHDKRVLDLGCGNGVISSYLFNHEISIVASDYSEEALKALHSKHPQIDIVQFDMTKTFPFIDNYFDVVIAELSLHYFNNRTTRKILAEISRILVPNGVLFARVNSTSEDYPLLNAIEITKDCFLVDGIKRRYYSIDSFNSMFNRNWKILEIEEQKTLKYRTSKSVIFCYARNIKHTDGVPS